MSGKCPDCEEGLPEWIMSYADMITILMAFFVVMYSMAGAKDKDKEEAVMKSLHERFGPNMPGLAALGLGPYVRGDSAVATLPATNGGKKNKKEKGKKRGGSDARASQGDHRRVHTLRPGEQIAVGGILYFPEGGSELAKEQRKQLEVTAEELSGKPQRIEVRGHTSRQPLPHGAPYRDNWDLAYARCRNTMRQLVALGIDARRIRLGVAADNEPPAGGDAVSRTSAGRVDVFLLDEVVAPATTSEPNDGAEPVKAGEA
jgi:chemotaxis protein MotB